MRYVPLDELVETYPTTLAKVLRSAMIKQDGLAPPERATRTPPMSTRMGLEMMEGNTTWMRSHSSVLMARMQSSPGPMAMALSSGIDRVQEGAVIIVSQRAKLCVKDILSYEDTSQHPRKYET